MKAAAPFIALCLLAAASGPGTAGGRLPPRPVGDRVSAPATIQCVIDAANAEGVPANVLLAIASVSGARNGERESALRPPAFGPEVDSAASKYGIDAAFVRAVIHAESAFNPNAVSVKGASGLMQLMPATAERFGVRNAFEPVQNIDGGTRYLAWLLKRFHGDTRLAAAAYNAGEGTVDRYDGVPPFEETQHYVERVDALITLYTPALGHFRVNPRHWGRGGLLARYPQVTQDAAAWDGCYNAALAAWLIQQQLQQPSSDDYWARLASYHSTDPRENAAYRSKLIPRAIEWGEWLQKQYQNEVLAITYQ